jgi:hypothetical protein
MLMIQLVMTRMKRKQLNFRQKRKQKADVAASLVDQAARVEVEVINQDVVLRVADQEDQPAGKPPSPKGGC